MGAEETQEYYDAVRGTHVVVLGVRGGKLINCVYDVPLDSNNFLCIRTTSYFQVFHRSNECKLRIFVFKIVTHFVLY